MLILLSDGFARAVCVSEREQALTDVNMNNLCFTLLKKLAVTALRIRAHTRYVSNDARWDFSALMRASDPHQKKSRPDVQTRFFLL